MAFLTLFLLCIVSYGYALDDANVTSSNETLAVMKPLPVEQCTDPNKEFHRCGTACPPSCEDPEPLKCTKQCIIGCLCKPGLVLDYQENCINQTDCPKSPIYIHPLSRFNLTHIQEICESKPNEEFAFCGSGPCQEKCVPDPPRPCFAMCYPGCYCKRGFVRDSNGACVDKKDCQGAPANATVV